MQEKQQDLQVKQDLKAVSKTKDLGKSMLDGMLKQVEAFAKLDQTPLNQQETAFALDILESVYKKVMEQGLSWGQIDIMGCGLYSQVKSYARLGLTIRDNELYIDIRNNGKTGLKDINIKKQYQGLEKELVKWCSKKIVRFYKDIVCAGDNLEKEFNFETGLTEIKKHEKDPKVDRNKLDNIIGAYAIAYVRELPTDTKTTPYMIYIDRNRIMRAYNASPTKEKTIWNLDTRKMVLKTASWELYNYFKPFIEIPIELKKDWETTKDEMNWETGEVIDVVETETASNELISFDEEVEAEPTQAIAEEDIQGANPNYKKRPF